MRTLKLFAICLTLLALLSGCASPGPEQSERSQLSAQTGGDDGIGGTGIRGDDGIGGTGIESDDGIGGTGIIAAVESTRPLKVAGLSVETLSTTRYVRNGKAMSGSSLGVGDIVAVEVKRQGRSLAAVRIEALDAMQGPITALDLARAKIEVMGRTVRVEPGSNGAGLTRFRRGQRVRVAGRVLPGGELQALRISAASSDEFDFYRGRLVAGAEGLSVDGLRLARSEASEAGVTPGSRVIVRGRFAQAALEPVSIVPLPALPFRQPVALLIIEGYPRVASAGSIAIGPARSISIDSNTRIDLRGGRLDSAPSASKLARVTAEVASDGSIRAARIGTATRPASLPDIGPVPIIDPRSTSTPESSSSTPSALERPAAVVDSISDSLVRPESLDRPAIEIVRPQVLERPAIVVRPDTPVRPDVVERPVTPVRPVPLDRVDVDVVRP